ncbi:MAG: M20/M25/M40 family metallo-hydrolase [SAR324 cluster bacterium]|nr:M20/M25/M40 family metallo-hydrolase [SAR324 cluster bacterium]
MSASRKDIENRVIPFWDEAILPTLTEYIRIPNQSPGFDKEWRKNGHMAKAVELVRRWVEAQQVPGLTLRVLEDGGRTPLLLCDIPGDLKNEVLIYGHLDKQPPMTGWRKHLGPWKPVYEKGKLYGRGGADDGYSIFAAIAVVKMMKSLGLPHGHIRILIECSEESGSSDLPHYLSAYAKAIGKPELVVCLDSGCGDYARLWSTTSLRGIVSATVRVKILREGVHSGMAGGIVPNPIQIMRMLLERLEDPGTGRLRPEALHVEIPPARIEQAKRAAAVLGGAVTEAFPLVKGGRALAGSPQQLLLNGTWEPAMTVISQSGLPELGAGGNVLLPEVAFRLSLRIPPTLSPREASDTLRKLLEQDPPFGAQVSVSAGGQPGWNAPEESPWLAEATDAASREFFGHPSCYFGIGGSIPFMDMIGKKFPKAQFLITGVLGPNSNAHGPNEFLHVPYAKKLTCCLMRVLEAHYFHHHG